MGTFAKWFAIGFAVFFVVGLYAGVHSRRDEKLFERDLLKAAALSVSAHSSQDGDVLLTYQCRGLSIFNYDVGKDKFRTEDRTFTGSNLSKLFSSVPMHIDVIASVLGVPGSLKIAALLTKPVPASERIQQIAGTVLGSLSGYGAGYWLASRGEVACDEPELLKFAGNPQSWKTIAKVVWTMHAARYHFRDASGSAVGGLRAPDVYIAFMGRDCFDPTACPDESAIDDAIEEVWGAALHATGEEPLTARDFLAVSRGVEQVRQWFAKHPEGLVVGSRRVVALDET